MQQSAAVILMILCFFPVRSQEELPRYNLEIGDSYFISQELVQQTETENRELRSGASLDINCTVEFKVSSIDPDGNYHFECRYRDLSLSFYSPRSDLYISSDNRAFSNIQTYLDELERQPFGLGISAHGEIIKPAPLDSIIRSVFAEERPDSAHHDLIIKTVREAFGENALTSLVNIAMNVYSDTLDDSNTKYATIAFNAKPMSVRNRFYYVPVDEKVLRVQGVGVIEETVDNYTRENSSIATTMQGQQTYDLVFNRETGWISRGISKQRIHSLSTIRGHAEFPDGLKVPSFTETEYIIKGGRVTDSDGS